MTYFLCDWYNSFPDEPVRIYCELDDTRYERRKVEVFADCRSTYADQQHEGGSRLSELVIPSLAEINSDPQFHATEISATEFNEAWERAQGST